LKFFCSFFSILEIKDDIRKMVEVMEEVMEEVIGDVVEHYPAIYIPMKANTKPHISIFSQRRKSCQTISRWYWHIRCRQKLRKLLFILYSPKLSLPTSIRQYVIGKYIL
jgi:hypothetical protein